MCEAAEAADRVFGVFENFRNTPATRHLKWGFDSGRLGALQMILVGYVGTWWAPNRIVAETPWRHRLLEAGGLTLDLGVHFLDQMRYVAGDPISVCGQTSVVERERVTLDKHGKETERIECDADDTFLASYEFPGNVPANMFASWAGHGSATKVGEGTVYYGSLARVTGGEATFDGGATAELGQLYQREAPDDLQQAQFPLGLTNNFALNQYDWLDAIRNKRSPETSGWEGLRDLAAAYAVLESHTIGRRVAVEEVVSGELREYQIAIDEHFGIRAG